MAPPPLVFRVVMVRMLTKYRWYTMENEAIYTTFNNVLKDRYRDMMRDLRKLSTIVSRRDGLPIQKEKWKKLSEVAQKNHNTPDFNRKTSRNTVGSIGYAEHRCNLRAQLGKDPEFCDLYVKTHGTRASDANFVVFGTTTSESTRSIQSNNNTQQEVDRLREEVSNMRQFQEQMVQQMERMMRMMNVTPNQAHTPPHTPPEDGV
ncbi:unnamed protein product [Lactuca virosa]|uniref:Myb/SANT-like domain-containing protein n=1 Tax=Lactuca virosa TaxID=75947 RepID=A0AAU9NSC6_9ASTR|nr:unnamed protein product [Lactuca virosa]